MFPLPLNRKHIASATCRGIARKEIRRLNRLPIRAAHSHCLGDGPILAGPPSSYPPNLRELALRQARASSTCGP